jgi:hypothetical protein
MKKMIALILALCLAMVFEPTVAQAKAPETQRLIVDNIEINTGEKTDIFGDGTAVYDPENSSLTLNNAKITKGAKAKGTEYAEYPGILFDGKLNVYLIGKNSIKTGADAVVMGEKLGNNSIVGGGILTIEGEEGATLDIVGMVQVVDLVEKSGTVNISVENTHSKIAKWALYTTGSISLQGGTLVAHGYGSKQGSLGAIMTDQNVEKSVSIADGAKLYEGTGAPGSSVKSLTWKKGQTFETKQYIKVVLPDLPAEKPDEAGNSEDDKAKKDIEISVKAGKGYNKITITLNNGTEMDGFQIYRSTDKKKGFKKIKTTSKSTFKDKKGLVAGTQYYYKVRGYVKVNGKKYYSDWSDAGESL